MPGVRKGRSLAYPWAGLAADVFPRCGGLLHRAPAPSSHIRWLLEFANKLAKQMLKVADTVKFGPQRVRLFGIDARETAQPCDDLRQPSRRGEQGADQLHSKGFGLAGHGRKSVGRSARCHAARARARRRL